MYRPTKDVLVVPTYGAGPDSWGEQPASSATAPTSAPATAPISASNERKSS